MALYKTLVKKVSISPEKKTKQKDYLAKGQLPIIDQGQQLIGGYSDNLDLKLSCNLPVIVFGDHTRAVKYIDFPFGAGADGIKVLEPVDGIYPKFLYYATQYLILRLEDRGYARHYQYIEKKELDIPSVPEQKRIVARIEELFSELDNGVATLQNVREQVSRYRYAAIENAIPYSNLRTIAECIVDMGQGWSPKCERQNTIDDETWAVIKTTAVQPCCFEFEENKVLPTSLVPREKHEIQVGDILITRAGPKSRCGVCCMVRKTKKRLLNCDKVYRIKVNSAVLLPEYLEYVLNSPGFIKEIALCKTGGNDSGLNLTQNRFLSIQIPVPTISEQKRIIHEIEARLSICDSIEKTVDTALQQAEAMRQSILKQAFEGRL